MEQPLSSKNERIVSANSSADAVISRPSKDAMGLPEPSDVVLELSTIRSQNAHTSLEQSFPFGGYDNNMGNWDGYSQYVNPESLHIVPPVIYSDSPSLMFHSGYGFNPEVAYGQYSPVASPLPSMMVDGQLYPQHISFSPSYYPHPAPQSVPHISSTVSVLPNELVMPESSNSHNMLMGPGSGYLMASGSYGGILSGNPGPGPVQSPGPYAQPLGILGTYEHSAGQLPQQRGSSHGAGSLSGSSRQQHSHANSYQNSTFGSSTLLYPGINDRNRPTLDKNRRRERDRDSICISNESLGATIDINRGPRAMKPKAKNIFNPTASGNVKHDSSTTSSQSSLYNQPDFATDYGNAKFFIIKSFSEDNVHKSIKYNVWASTPHGNKKLDAAYHEAKEMTGNCPVFLFFSVNGSGQFCGVAEMVGPVDFEKDADYWQQDRWSGQFPVRWHIIKDVSNSYFRHILLENNDNKPVTHSRDSQEVKLEQGIEMLKIFKNFEQQTSLIDDFDFYDERERLMKENKARQRGASTADAPHSLANESVKQITDSFAHTLRLEESDKVAVAIEGGPSRPDASDSLSLGSIKQAFDSFARAQQTEGDGKSSSN